ncbi:hypothetical protein D3C80_1611170 [compost metagenome]
MKKIRTENMILIKGCWILQSSWGRATVSVLTKLNRMVICSENLSEPVQMKRWLIAGLTRVVSAIELTVFCLLKLVCRMTATENHTRINLQYREMTVLIAIIVNIICWLSLFSCISLMESGCSFLPEPEFSLLFP